MFPSFRDALRNYDKHKPNVAEGKIQPSPFLMERPPGQADFRAHGRFDKGEVTMEHLGNGKWGGSFGVETAVMAAFKTSSLLHNHPFAVSGYPFPDLLNSFPSPAGKDRGDLLGIYHGRHEIITGPCGIARMDWLGRQRRAEMESDLRVFVMMEKGNIRPLAIALYVLKQKMELQLELELQGRKLMAQLSRQAPLRSEGQELKAWDLGCETMTLRAFLSAFDDTKSLNIKHSFHAPQFPLYVLRDGTQMVAFCCELTFVAWRHFGNLFKMFNRDAGHLLDHSSRWGNFFTSKPTHSEGSATAIPSPP